MLSQQEMDATLESFQQDLIERRAEQFTQLAETNEKEGMEFLERNKDKEGWEVLPSGLQYKVVKEGESVGTKRRGRESARQGSERSEATAAFRLGIK